MPHHFTNKEVVNLLEEIVAAFKVKNADGFRIRAYENAAAAIDNLAVEVYDLWQSQKLTDIPGVGPNLASHFEELFTTGQVSHFTQVKKDLPAGMFALLKVPGIGPKTAFALAKLFNLASPKTAIQDSIKEIKAGKLTGQEGFQEKSIQKLIQNLEKSLETKDLPERMPLAKADELVDQIINDLKDFPEIEKISPLGSVRRRAETVGDLDIGIASRDPAKLAQKIANYPSVKKVLAIGDKLVRVILKNGFQVDFKLTKPGWWGSLLQHFTGSKQHNIGLRELAVKKGMSMSEQGMKINGRWQRYSSEENFYKQLGLDWITPELRENTGEIDAAKKHQLPQLVELSDIKGDLHIHSNYPWVSSHDAGKNSFAELVDQALKLNYEYIGLGDHNPSASNVSSEKIYSLIKDRNKKIEHIKAQYENSVKNRSLVILKSLEVDIKPDGELAISRESATLLDYLVVSIHSTFDLSTKDMTKRILTALSYPKVKILGHPTGRLFGRRAGYQLDWDQIFEFCQKHNVALEVNGAPGRLDLSDVLVREAINHGVRIVIDTDSHNLAHFDFMRYGVSVARRGWATTQDIVNTWPAKKFLDWLQT